MHSAGLELAEMTYTRLGDKLIRHRSDRFIWYRTGGIFFVLVVIYSDRLSFLYAIRCESTREEIDGGFSWGKKKRRAYRRGKGGASKMTPDLRYPLMSPMPSLVSSWGRYVVWHFFLFSLPCFLFLSCLFLLFLSLLFFLFLFRYFAFLSCLSFPLSPFLFFVSFFPIDLRLSCVCVVIGTPCNIYVVVFPGWQAVQSVFPGASNETYAPVWTWH